MPNEKPRILVGCPTAEIKHDSLERYIEGLNELTYPRFDVAIEDNSLAPHYSQKIKKRGKEWEKNHPGKTFRVIHTENLPPRVHDRIVQGRNKLREIALNENYDYFFSLEQDVVPPPNILEELVNAQKKVIGGVYVNRVLLNNTEEKIIPVLMAYKNEEMKAKKVAEWTGYEFLSPARVTEVACIGMGALLIHRSVLEKITFRVDEKSQAFDDIYFALDCLNANIPIYCHTGMLCGHYYNQAFTKMGKENF